MVISYSIEQNTSCKNYYIHLGFFDLMCQFIPEVDIQLASSNNLLLLGFFLLDLLVTKEGQEYIVSNLDGVDVKKTLRWGDEGEVNSMCRDPNSPTSHNSSL
jgi:hypothetical protein